MYSAVTLSILIFFQFYIVDAKLQLHPKFKIVNPLLADFTGSIDSVWTPNRQTVLLHIMKMRYWQRQFNIDVIIEQLPSKEDMSLKFRFKCSPGDKEYYLQFKHPFKINNTVCRSTLPLSIETKHANWISETVYHLTLEVKTAGRTKVPFSQALTHYVRIQMDFTGPHWSLKSNGLFIRNWDALTDYKRHRNGIRGRRFLSNEAINLIRYANYTGNSGFGSEQFIDPKVVSLINNAPEFVQSTIGIGAFLAPIGGRCKMLRRGKEVTFLSSHSGDSLQIHDYPSTPIMRLDTANGKLAYSRHGLRALLHSVDANIHDWHYSAEICFWLDYEPRGAAMYYVFREEFFHNRKRVPPFKKRAPMNDCKVLHQKRVTYFARTGMRYIFCPIICANASQPFKFFKGRTPLIPRPDSLGVVSTNIIISGTVLMLQRITHKDSGEYRCTAGGKEAKFMVDIVALPLFSVQQTAWEGGNLPPVTYAKTGHGYSLNCTVFYSGMRSVTLTPEFYVVPDKRTSTWSKLSGDEFARHMERYDSKVTISSSKTPHSTTLTLHVSRVPHPTSDFDFSHRYVCNAAISAQDARRFGVTEYNVQSGSQVVVVTPPTADDIEFSASPCCMDGCIGETCNITYTLKPDVYNDIKSIGLDVCARFKDGDSELGPKATKHVKYDKDSAALMLRVDKPINSMTDEEKRALMPLLPVFEYVVKSNVTSGSPSGQCSCSKNRQPSNPPCIATTDDLKKSEKELLTIGQQLKLMIESAGTSDVNKLDYKGIMLRVGLNTAVRRSAGCCVHLAAVLVCFKTIAAYWYAADFND